MRFERFLAQTQTTPVQSVVSDLEQLGSIRSCQSLVDAIGDNCKILKVSEDKAQ